MVYSSRLPLSTQTLTFCGDLLRAHRTKIGSRWRCRSIGRIVLLVFAVLRHDQRLRDIAAANGISASTLKRWVDELVELIAARAPRLERALAKVRRSGGEVVLLDGTLIKTYRRTGKHNRRNYNGKHKAHGLLFLGITDEKGNLLWISRGHHGSASEIATSRGEKLLEHLRAAGLGALADRGFIGLDRNPEDPIVITGVKKTSKKPLTAADKLTNQIIAAHRAPNEHGFAFLKNWRCITKLRINPIRATTLLRALLVLANLENAR
jgi:hypothetical protein